MKTKKAKIVITLGLLSPTLILISTSRGRRYHYVWMPNNPLDPLRSTLCEVKR